MKRTLALIPVLLFSGCLPEGGVGFESDPEPTADPSAEFIGGAYQVQSEFDLTAASVYPEPVADTYSVLVDLRENPAAALVTLLADANVPVVDDLYGALPSVLTSRLEGWMNGYISNTPLAEVLDMIIAHADAVLTRFTLVSEIDLELAQRCRSTQHRLRDFRYRVGSVTLMVPIGDLPEPAFAVSADVQACVSTSDRADAQLSLDAHTFGLAYGRYAYAALELATQEIMGASLRDVIADTIDCPGLAQSVANKCVLSVCVGHEQQLNALCEAGVDEVVGQLRVRMESMNFDALHLESGTADMMDAVNEGGARDGIIDRIAAGTWDASVDVGLGPRALPARFRASRM